MPVGTASYSPSNARERSTAFVGSALQAREIEQMNVAIDDGNVVDGCRVCRPASPRADHLSHTERALQWRLVQ
jgi:hypothetical protein